jgi:predicted lactoylglutathione lyase
MASSERIATRAIVNPWESPVTPKIFVSLPVADLHASVAFYLALGFQPNRHFSDAASACMQWSEAICVMLLTHAKWRSFTQRPFPPAGTSALMLSLTMDSRDAVDVMNRAAAAHGGQADVNPAEDHGFMYSRDLADPDGHLWAVLWMDPASIPPADALG